SDAWRPALGKTGQDAADRAEAGLPEHRLRAEEGEVIVHALAVGPRMRLDSRRAALSGVLDRRADHRDRDAPAAVTAPHRDARDDPGRDVVDWRRRLRIRDAGEVVAWTERDETDRFLALIRHQTGGVLPAPRQLRESLPALLLDRARRAERDPKLALFRRGVSRVEVPAGGAP